MPARYALEWAGLSAEQAAAAAAIGYDQESWDYDEDYDDDAEEDEEEVVKEEQEVVVLRERVVEVPAAAAAAAVKEQTQAVAGQRAHSMAYLSIGGSDDSTTCVVHFAEFTGKRSFSGSVVRATPPASYLVPRLIPGTGVF